MDGYCDRCVTTRENRRRSSPDILVLISIAGVVCVIMIFVGVWGMATHPDARFICFLVALLASVISVFLLNPVLKRYLDAKRAVAHMTVWTDMVNNAHEHGSPEPLSDKEILKESKNKATLVARFERWFNRHIHIMEVVGPEGSQRLQETNWRARIYNGEPLYVENGNYVELGRLIDTGASTWNRVFDIAAEPFHKDPLESYEVLVECTVFGMAQLLAHVLKSTVSEDAMLIFLNQLTGHAEEEPEVTLDLLRMARAQLRDQLVPDDHPIFAELDCRVHEIENPHN